MLLNCIDQKTQPRDGPLKIQLFYESDVRTPRNPLEKPSIKMFFFISIDNQMVTLNIK